MADEGIDIDSLMEAGRIARRIREKAINIIREGASILDVCNILEESIRDLGGKPAFPCNICINEIAAHYTASPGEQSVIPSRSIVKVDVGVSVNGYIADTAITISFDPNQESLVEAVNKALMEALKIIRPGAPVSVIGATIQKTIRDMRFKPIRNLTGHEIARYNLHAGLSIPNVQTIQTDKLKIGHVYAIEPFATTIDGAGEVVPLRTATIYRLSIEKIDRSKLEREELEFAEMISGDFGNLPYTTRWIKEFDKVKDLHEKMVRKGRIHSYPVLVEKNGKPVSQAEHTILVTEDGCKVIT